MFRWTDGGYAPAGELTFEGAGRTRLGRFVYAASYLRREGANPISLPLRKKSEPVNPEEVPLAFHDAEPDRWGKEVLTRAFPGSDFALLNAL